MKRFLTQYFWYIIGALFIVFFFFGTELKRMVYPYLLGVKTTEVPQISGDEYFEDVEMAPFVFKRHKKKYTLQPKTIYAVNGRVGIVDHYDTMFQYFYRGQFQGDYITLVPQDLFLVIGDMAEDGIFQKFEFEHEERLGRVLCKNVKYRNNFMPSMMTPKQAQKNFEKYQACQRYINQDEQNNYHPIPANRVINAALSMLKKGDRVYLEGYLVDVPHMGLKTGTRKNQYHENIKIGAFSPGMCFILYTTKVITGGRVYE